MTSILFPNFYSTASLLAAIFSAYLGFLFYRIPKRSKASSYFVLVSLFMVLLHGGYALASLVYHPLMAYHKVVAIAAGLFGSLFGAQMILHFPREQKNFFTRQMPVIQFVIAAGLVILFAISAPLTEKRYIFSGHSWDFNTGILYQIISLVILIYFIIGYISGYTKAFLAQGNHRVLLLLLTTSYFILTFIPGVLNMLSRYGIVDREIYLIYDVLLNLIGFFFVSLIFINNLKERTSIMHKIVSIALLTMLVIIQAFGYYWLKDVDSSYTEIYSQEARKKNALQKTSESAGTCRLDLSSLKFSCLDKTKTFENDPHFAPEIRNDLQNIYVLNALEQISQGKTEEINFPLPSLSLAGLLAQEFSEKYTAQKSLQKIQEINSTLFTLREKLYPLSRKQKPQKLYHVISTSKLPEKTKKILIEELSTIKSPDERFQTALILLSPFPDAGDRLYRGKDLLPPETRKTSPLFVSFISFEDQSISETFFPYLHYRNYMSGSAWLLTGMLFIITTGLIFSFRFFFLGALIHPLERVINGVKKVNSGDLSTRVRVEVEDEIGFLAHSFNQMTNSIHEAREKLIHYADTLEDKVEERTKELHETLLNVQTLKSQQDGDYFLTTLLVQPLTQNRVQSNSYEIEFFIRQKKKFEFKKWSREIGGDYCLASTLTLQNKTYHLITNADAMGKSIQGAGGALVLGSVLHSIIERTYLSPHEKNIPPERWLKNTLVELHHVFESFDGSMLISLVIGLLDEESGLLYFINAEHPMSILYRDEKASFIENTEYLLRKLGMPEANNTFSVHTFQMQQNDIILFGSDGRDDYYLNTENNEETINEDESYILSVVTKEKANLESIYQFLNKQFTLIDDVSLLSIKRVQPSPLEEKISAPDELVSAFNTAVKLRKEEKPEESLQILLNDLPALENYPAFQLDVMRETVRVQVTLKNFKSVQTTAGELFQMNPGDSEMLYILSYAARKNNDLETAVETGERLRLRNPEHIRNLINLSECHLKLKNIPRAKQLYEEARIIDETHAGIKKIAAILEKSDRSNHA